MTYARVPGIIPEYKVLQLAILSILELFLPLIVKEHYLFFCVVLKKIAPNNKFLKENLKNF